MSAKQHHKFNEKLNLSLNLQHLGDEGLVNLVHHVGDGPGHVSVLLGGAGRGDGRVLALAGQHLQLEEHFLARKRQD